MRADEVQTSSVVTQWLQSAGHAAFSAYCITAAFTTYFCMYAFRKPFTAGEFSDVVLWGIGYKTILVASQVMGYTLSKFIGIKVISEMPPNRRAMAIIGLILFAEFALLLFAIVPPPFNSLMLFVNGLPLGMVFGLVLSFLEGRRMTEMLSAGLCASFIVSSGVVKSVGRALIVDYGISEYWMPFLTGLIFFIPLLLGVTMLRQIPRPSGADMEERNERTPMSRIDRSMLLRRHAWGLSGLITVYVLLTVIRSIRDDFAVELWQGLGYQGTPAVYANSELAVVIGVLIANGVVSKVRDNRAAFLTSLVSVAAGFVLVLSVIWAQQRGHLSAFTFMVLIGLGTYVPYVMFHTTIFERLLAVFRDRGNLGFLMYLADATGYLGYVLVMVIKNFTAMEFDVLPLYMHLSLWIAALSSIITLVLLAYYFRAIVQPRTVQGNALSTQGDT
ncbi:MAG: hypothetical protein KDA92_02775 [Planctomycetales bacterium]|nr:hypothetical protein [Planctomycetales bacterium]